MLGSAHSERYNQSFMSSPTKQNFNNSAMHYPAHKKLDTLGQTIKDMQDGRGSSIPVISMINLTIKSCIFQRMLDINRQVGILITKSKIVIDKT